MRGRWEAGADQGGQQGEWNELPSLLTIFFSFFYSLNYVSTITFTGDLENIEQSYIQFYSILQFFK